MKELLLEVKELIDAGKPEEAKAKIDEVIAVLPSNAAASPEEIKPTDPPLPGQGTNGEN